jgi:hypothetical protein
MVTYQQVQKRLAQAESRGELSEFYALCLRSMAAISHGAEFAVDYLEMAELVAATTDELELVTEIRFAHDRLQASRLVATADRPLAHPRRYGPASLWTSLLHLFCTNRSRGAPAL